MHFHRRHRQRMPMLNTASLPDLIFTVLFFFMMVTHMRNAPLRVAYKMPQGDNLTQIDKQAHTLYIYIGFPLNDTQRQTMATKGQDATEKTVVQIGDRYLTPAEVTDYIAAERASLLPQDRARMVVSIRADRNVKMKVIDDVRQAIRQAGVSRILMSAEGKVATAIADMEQKNRKK